MQHHGVRNFFSSSSLSAWTRTYYTRYVDLFTFEQCKLSHWRAYRSFCVFLFGVFSTAFVVSTLSIGVATIVSRQSTNVIEIEQQSRQIQFDTIQWWWNSHLNPEIKIICFRMFFWELLRSFILSPTFHSSPDQRIRIQTDMKSFLLGLWTRP